MPTILNHLAQPDNTIYGIEAIKLISLMYDPQVSVSNFIETLVRILSSNIALTLPTFVTEFTAWCETAASIIDDESLANFMNQPNLAHRLTVILAEVAKLSRVSGFCPVDCVSYSEYFPASIVQLCRISHLGSCNADSAHALMEINTLATQYSMEQMYLRDAQCDKEVIRRDVQELMGPLFHVGHRIGLPGLPNALVIPQNAWDAVYGASCERHLTRDFGVMDVNGRDYLTKVPPSQH